MSGFGSIDSLAGTSTAELLKQKSSFGVGESSSDAFSSHLKSALNEVNQLQEDKEEVTANLATGQVQDLHQAALAIGKAETSMKMMLEIRNKALSAYKELGRTQI